MLEGIDRKERRGNVHIICKESCYNNRLIATITINICLCLCTKLYKLSQQCMDTKVMQLPIYCFSYCQVIVPENHIFSAKKLSINVYYKSTGSLSWNCAFQ